MIYLSSADDSNQEGRCIFSGDDEEDVRRIVMKTDACCAMEDN
jgi:hypothetical protein